MIRQKVKMMNLKLSVCYFITYHVVLYLLSFTVHSFTSTTSLTSHHFS